MKTLKFKKITLSEMPSEDMGGALGGNVNQDNDLIGTVILISIYTVSIVATANDDCATFNCSNLCQRQSKASYCLCSGYTDCR